MQEEINAATAMLGLDGFILLAVSQQNGELEQAVETTASHYVVHHHAGLNHREPEGVSRGALPDVLIGRNWWRAPGAAEGMVPCTPCGSWGIGLAGGGRLSWAVWRRDACCTHVALNGVRRVR